MNHLGVVHHEYPPNQIPRYGRGKNRYGSSDKQLVRILSPEEKKNEFKKLAKDAIESFVTRNGIFTDATQDEATIVGTMQDFLISLYDNIIKIPSNKTAFMQTLLSHLHILDEHKVCVEMCKEKDPTKLLKYAHDLFINIIEDEMELGDCSIQDKQNLIALIDIMNHKPYPGQWTPADILNTSTTRPGDGVLLRKQLRKEAFKKTAEETITAFVTRYGTFDASTQKKEAVISALVDIIVHLYEHITANYGYKIYEVVKTLNKVFVSMYALPAHTGCVSMCKEHDTKKLPQHAHDIFLNILTEQMTWANHITRMTISPSVDNEHQYNKDDVKNLALIISAFRTMPYSKK